MNMLEERLEHEFADAVLLETALTHPSAAYEEDGSRGNERLEYLGDAVLDLVIGRILFERHPDWHEGKLTRARAALVNKDSLAARARELDLGAEVRLGRTEQLSHGEEKDSVLANCFEAVMGALYLDAGIEATSRLAERLFAAALDDEDVLARDPKTAFQEWAHARLGVTPRYVVIEDNRLEDSEERFTVSVLAQGQAWGRGRGRSKRVAERAAAAAALERAGERA